MNAAHLLPAVGDLYSKHPEYRNLEPGELIGLLWLLGYTDSLAEEGEIAAAAAVARTNWTGAAVSPFLFSMRLFPAWGVFA